jgi:ribose 5-phosphate isomerase B
MIAIGCDHGGYALKEEIKKYLDEKEIEYKDFGTDSTERTDFPIYAKKVAKAVQTGECEVGILICKTGFGMAITANKFKGIRCAACYDESTAKQAKEHSNINILALPAEYVSISKAVAMIRVWLGSEFLKGRYLDRVQMIKEIEDENMK